MADQLISDLTAGSALTGADLFEAEQSSTSVKITAAQIAAYVIANPGGTSAQFLRGDGVLGNTLLGPIIVNTDIKIWRGLFNDAGSLSIGVGALASTASGTGNCIAIGQQALTTATTSPYSVAIGTYAASAATTANNITAVGFSALGALTSGNDNTGFGSGVLGNVTDGIRNSGFGVGTGGGIVNGSYNTILGANVGGLSASLTDNIILATGQGTKRLQFDGTYWSTSYPLGIGGDPGTQSILYVASQTTNSYNYGYLRGGTIPSTTTALASGYDSYATTAAASFTLPEMRHFHARQGAIGAGSTVTVQKGFSAESTLTGATTNYGFYGDIAAGTGRYNIYMNGTASNYLAGALGIGATPLVNTNQLYLGRNLTGSTTVYGVYHSTSVLSDVTSSATGFVTTIGTQAASFTLGSLIHYQAQQAALGASSAITNQYGFYAESNMTGATNNYGFFGNIGAATGRWNLYMSGSAANYLLGQLNIGTNTLDTTALLLLSSTTQGFLPPRMTTTQRDAISSPTEGLIVYNSTTHKINVRTASAWEAVTSV